MVISDIATLSLSNDEVNLFADSLTSFVNPGSTSADIVKFSVEELLCSFQRISSLPWDKSCCALPCLLDALLALSLHNDKTIATSALEVLWNIYVGIQYYLCSRCIGGLWGLVVVRLPWLSGRGLAAQARDVLGSTPGSCWPFSIFTS